MPDVWSMAGKLDAATQERLADVLETRGADAQQQQRDARGVPGGHRVPRRRAGARRGLRDGGVDPPARPRAERGLVVGVDVAPSLLDRARALCAALPNVAFVEGALSSAPGLGTRELLVRQPHAAVSTRSSSLHNARTRS